ncbi:hypothetical protein ACFL1R_03655 [Candidatus Latescibacterota bacterium]
MWLRNIIVLGLIVFFLLSFKTGLNRKTKFRTKKAYSSGWFLFITLLFLWTAHGNMQIIGKSIIFGTLLCVPLCIYEKRWIDKRIEGTTLYQRLRHDSRVIPIVILFLCFWKQIVGLIWPITGFFFALFSTQVYILFYALILERKFGAPILEDEK